MRHASSKRTGRTSDDGETCGTSRQSQSTNGELTASLEATRASRIAEPWEGISQAERILRVSSSELLMYFARALWSERIRHSCESARLLHGGPSEAAWNSLVTLACPSNCEPAVLGLSTSGSECSCSVSYPTPTATDWKGGKARKRGRQANLRDLWKEWTGQTYLPPEVSAAVQGLPIMWTKCEP